ncbi:MAG: tetratricopeptide repeat protein, partial [Steroidobacter sp.]
EGRERAAQRSSTPQALSSRLRGDLDWIALKAIEKDRRRRYASAAELAADIDRHTRHEAVLAGPPSTTYRVRKLARRHRVATTMLVTLFIAAIVFGSGMGWLAHKVALERDRANQEALLARRVTTFTAGLFELANPASLGATNITARQLLDAGVARLETQLDKEQPYVRAALLEATGNAYRGLGVYDRAERALEAAVDLRAGDEPLARATTLLNMALLRRDQGDFPRAEIIAREAVRLLEPTSYSPFQQRANLELAEILRRRNQTDEAALLAEASMQAGERAGAVRTREYAHSLLMLGRIRVAQSRLAEGEELLRRAVVLQEELNGNLGEETLDARFGLADALVIMDEPVRAVAIYRELIRDARAVYGENHPQVGIVYNDLGNALTDIPERVEEGLQMYLQALHIHLRVLGPNPPEVAIVYNNIGAAYLKLKEWSQASTAYEKAVAIRVAALGPDNLDTQSTQVGRALALNKLEQYAEARALLSEAKTVFTNVLGADHWRTANVRHYLGLVLMNEHMFAEAERELRAAYDIDLRTLGPEHARTEAVAKTLKELEEARATASGGPDRGNAVG